MSRTPEDRRPDGDADLALAWREASRDEPPAALDAAIRAAARRAVDARPQATASSPFAGRWRVPLSVAAVLVLSATITLLVSERDRHGSPALQDQAAPPSAAPAPQARTGEPAAGLPQTPPRQHADRGAPRAPKSVTAREQESAHEARTQREESKAPSSPPPSAEQAQATAQPSEQQAPQAAADQRTTAEAHADKAERADSRQSATAPPAPSPAAAPPLAAAPSAPSPGAAPPPAAGPTVPSPAAEAPAAAASSPPASDASRGAATLDPPAGLAKREMRPGAGPAQSAVPRAPAAPQLGGPRGDARRSEPQAFSPLPRTESAADLASAPDADTENLDPKAWLDRILELRREGKLEQAAKSLKAFRERYPDYPLPEDLRLP